MSLISALPVQLSVIVHCAQKPQPGGIARIYSPGVTCRKSQGWSWCLERCKKRQSCDSREQIKDCGAAVLQGQAGAHSCFCRMRGRAPWQRGWAVHGFPKLGNHPTAGWHFPRGQGSPAASEQGEDPWGWISSMISLEGLGGVGISPSVSAHRCWCSLPVQPSTEPECD